MNIESMFPSKYVSAADLNGQSVPVTISRVSAEEVEPGKPKKPVAYFQGCVKGMVLNKTNGKRIATQLGTSETDLWIGKQIVIYPSEVDFQGRTVKCIRVNETPPMASPPVVQVQPQQVQQSQQPRPEVAAAMNGPMNGRPF